MCGILGYYSSEKCIGKQKFTFALNKLAHRGPDDSGIYMDDNLLLGHRRLSIIDVDGGGQPMSSPDGRYTLIYNGEIYNYKEIRSSLKNKKWHSNSDTEVLLQAYIELGEKCLNIIRGMYAFGIYDKQEKEIFIARDHFGIKPLYIYNDKETLVFSSELQSVKSFETTDMRIDLDSIDIYLRLNYIPSPYSAFKNVRKLKPGHYAVYKLADLTYSENSYYSFEFKPDYNTDCVELISNLEQSISESVKYHTISDVPFGAFLSGGIDSTLIASLMRDHLGQGVKAFTIDFEQGFSELKYAQEAASILNLDHYSIKVEPDAINLIDDLVKHCGEPFGDSSIIPTYYLSKLTKNHVKMVLSGDGADEFFGGYKSYYRWIKRIEGFHRSFYGSLIFNLSYLKNGRKNPLRTLENWLKETPGLKNENRHNLWKNEYQDHFLENIADFLETFHRTKSLHPLQQAQQLDIEWLLQGNMLPKVDIASMMNSLEVRTPFVDVKVAEMASRLPSNLYFDANKKGFNGKKPLKGMLSHKFSMEFINRPKHGFTLPLGYWFGNDKGFKDLIGFYFTSENSPLLDYFNLEVLNEIQTLKQKDQMWSLIFLGKWLETTNHS